LGEEYINFWEIKCIIWGTIFYLQKTFKTSGKIVNQKNKW
jgi:hypothetical protein